MTTVNEYLFSSVSLSVIMLRIDFVMYSQIYFINEYTMFNPTIAENFIRNHSLNIMRWSPRNTQWIGYILQFDQFHDLHQITLGGFQSLIHVSLDLFSNCLYHHVIVSFVLWDTEGSCNDYKQCFFLHCYLEYMSHVPIWKKK